MRDTMFAYIFTILTSTLLTNTENDWKLNKHYAVILMLNLLKVNMTQTLFTPVQKVWKMNPKKGKDVLNALNSDLKKRLNSAWNAAQKTLQPQS